ncbi:hypothetical protein ERO13_D06G183666v2 [Gossypium hirsutum]|nr:hypothetical protein ERO13_D06G183666v2 [Gossypium hirsutum]
MKAIFAQMDLDDALLGYQLVDLNQFLFTNRIGVDEWLRVPTLQDVFSIRDCSGFLESTGKPVLPPLAQVQYRVRPKLMSTLLNYESSFPFIGMQSLLDEEIKTRL